MVHRPRTADGTGLSHRACCRVRWPRGGRPAHRGGKHNPGAGTGDHRAMPLARLL